jgi:preprotein translocase subunit SecA
LWDLKAVEVLPVIERAFTSGRVDESVMGDVEDVQIEFGLKTQREHPRKPNSLTIMGEQLRAQWKAAGIPLPDDVDDDLPEPEDDFPGLDLEPPAISRPYIAPPKVGRNEPCPCGSGKKYKKCCGG